MIKLLLSITIWYRKYQGRDGNYYTIANAVATRMIFIYLSIYSIGAWTGKLLKIENNFITSSAVPLILVMILGFIHFQLLINRLRKRKIFLGYKQYKLILHIYGILSIVVSVLLLALEFESRCRR